MPRYHDDHLHVHHTGGRSVGVRFIFALLVLGLFAGLVALVVGVASLG